MSGLGGREGGEARKGLTIKGRGKLANAADNGILVRQIQECVTLGAKRHGAARGHGGWRVVGVGRRRACTAVVWWSGVGGGWWRLPQLSWGC